MKDTTLLFNRIKKVRVSDTVVEQILFLVEEGKIKVGDYLPGERELVDQLQVARASVREALRILEFQGIIEVQAGKGAVVVRNPADSDSDDEGVRRWFREHASEVMEILEVREALEGRAARLAAIKASNEEIEGLRFLISQADEYISHRDIDKLVQLDRDFHRMVANSSGVQILSQLIEMIIDAMVNPRRSLMRLPQRAQQSWLDHKLVLLAISERDEDKAERAIANHLDNVRNAINALLESTPNST